jgi:hypothetical protein
MSATSCEEQAQEIADRVSETSPRTDDAEAQPGTERDDDSKEGIDHSDNNHSKSRVLLKDARIRHFKNETGNCRHGRCIAVCHFDSSRHRHERTILLPLQSIRAVLKSKHFRLYDYVGKCRAHTDSEDEDHDDDHDDNDCDENDDMNPGDDTTSGNTSGDNTTVTSGDTTTTTSGDSTTVTSGDNTTTTDPTIPDWCVPVQNIDQNCDGLSDTTGLPYF